MADELEFEVELADDINGYTPLASQEEPPAGESAKSTEQKPVRTADSEGDKGEGERSERKPRSRLKERVGELTRLWRTEERERERFQREAEQREQQLAQKDQEFQEYQKQTAHTVHKTLSSNKKLLERQMEQARKTGDFDTERQIHDELIRVGSSIHQLEQQFPGVQDMRPDQLQHSNGQQPTQGQQQQQPATQSQKQGQQPATPQQLPEAAQDWAQANAWMKGNQEVINSVAHHDSVLRRQGMDPTSVDFYKKLNERLKMDLPEDQASKLRLSYNDDLDDLEEDEGDTGGDDTGSQQQQQAAKQSSSSSQGMASGSRTAAAPKGKQKVKITADERAYCQRNGCDVQEFAKQKALVERSEGNSNGYTPIN
jgi:hypothetical protein